MLWLSASLWKTNLGQTMWILCHEEGSERLEDYGAAICMIAAPWQLFLHIIRVRGRKGIEIKWVIRPNAISHAEVNAERCSCVFDTSNHQCAIPAYFLATAIGTIPFISKITKSVPVGTAVICFKTNFNCSGVFGTCRSKKSTSTVTLLSKLVSE